MLDTKALAAATATIVREHVAAATKPLLDRIAALEARQPEKGERGEAGGQGPAGKDGADGTAGEKGADGKDAPAPTAETVLAALQINPAPILDAVKAWLEANPPAAGPVGPPGPAGPTGPQGESIKGDPGADGKDGKDGVGMAGAILDRAGSLVITMSNGEARELGVVVGKDGAPGANGKDGEPGRDGKDGADGADGADGVGFDDMKCEIRDAGVFLVWEKGETVKEARLPVPLYQGVFKEGQNYQTGHSVTWGGSTWIAQRDTADKPETTDAWRLSTKRGRDGKPGKDGERGPEGTPGRPGKDGISR